MTASGIDAVNADVAILAGYFLILIPFLTAALARGAVAIGSLSQSILAPVQSSAAAAGGEVATGNISLGNTSFDTHRYDQMSAHSRQTSPSQDTGVFTYRTPEGANVSITPDGRQVVQGGGAASNFPAGINYSQSISDTLSNRAAQSREQGSSFLAQSRESFATVNQQISDLARSVGEGRSIQQTTGLNEDARVTENVSNLLEHAESFAQQNGTDTQTALDAFATASALLKVGQPGLVDMVNPVDFEASIRAGTTGSARASSRETFTAARNYTERNNLGDLFDETSSALNHLSVSDTGSEGTQFRDVLAQNLNRASSFEESANERFSSAERFEDALVSQQREGADFNQRLDQTFFEYLSEQRSDSGTEFGPAEARRLLVSQNPEDQRIVRQHANDFVDDYVDREIGPSRSVDLAEPPLNPSFNSRQDQVDHVQEPGPMNALQMVYSGFFVAISKAALPKAILLVSIAQTHTAHLLGKPWIGIEPIREFSSQFGASEFGRIMKLIWRLLVLHICISAIIFTGH